MVWLGYSEDEVWALTPRKWKALTDKHLELYKQKYGVETQDDNGPLGYIDQIGI